MADRIKSPGKLFAPPGILEYNGFRFGIATKTSVSSNPVYTDSGIQVKYVQYVINAESVIVAEDGLEGTTNDGFEKIRKRLLVPGARLIAVRMGFGADVDTLKFPDVIYGPKPRILNWQPIGADKACRFTWQCEVHLPTCFPKQTYTGNPLLAFEYSVQWSLDNAGMLTRTITGYAEIRSIVDRTNPNRPAVIDTARNIEQADELRERIAGTFPIPKPPPIFERTQNYRRSDDLRRLEFTLTDTESPSPTALFPGVIRMDVTETLGNWRQFSFARWEYSLSGNIEVAPGFPKAIAWWALLQIIDRKRRIWGRERTNLIKNRKGTFKADKQFNAQFQHTPMIKRISLTDQLFSRQVSFNVEMIASVPLEYFLQAWNMLRPLYDPGQDIAFHNAWYASVADVRGPRGFTKTLNAPQDTYLIVSICDQQMPFAGVATPEIPGTTPGGSHRRPGEGDPYAREPPFKPVPPANAFLDYQLDAQYDEDDNTVPGTILVDPATAKAVESFEEMPSALDYMKRSTTLGTKLTTDDAHYTTAAAGKVVRVQKRAAPTYELVITGFGVRVGYGVPIPSVESIANQKPALLSRKVSTGAFARGEWPIYYAKWRLRYALEQMPQGDLNDLDTHKIIGHPFREGLA